MADNVNNVTKTLRDLRNYLVYLEGQNSNGMIHHDCEFILFPERGYCSICDMWSRVEVVLGNIK